MKNIAVFASGTGSNFEALADAVLNHEIYANLALLVSDRPLSKVVEKAKKRGITTFTFSAKNYPSKEAYETEIKEQLDLHNIELVALAGYMRIVGPTLLNAYEGKIINIHPSLLPHFKGKDAVGQAMEAGVTETGVTVHYIDAGVDTGTIIAQQKLDISQLHTREQIETEIHKIEHQLYKKTIQELLEGQS